MKNGKIVDPVDFFLQKQEREEFHSDPDLHYGSSWLKGPLTVSNSDTLRRGFGVSVLVCSFWRPGKFAAEIPDPADR